MEERFRLFRDLTATEYQYAEFCIIVLREVDIPLNTLCWKIEQRDVIPWAAELVWTQRELIEFSVNEGKIVKVE